MNPIISLLAPLIIAIPFVIALVYYDRFYKPNKQNKPEVEHE